MIDTKKARDIVHALRCRSTVGIKCIGKSCMYSISGQLGGEVFETCDIYKVGLDAAEMIEALLADNERMSDLLMVMRIKMTGDCGVCRHQHVNVRDEPCASCIMTEGRDGWQYEGDEEHGEP